jgi:hypothetical protein
MMQNLLFGLVLQLWLAASALAAPLDNTVTATGKDAWQYGTGGGILGFIVLILDIIVFGMCRRLPFRYRWMLEANHLSLRSRGPEVEPPSRLQAPLVPGGLLLPHHWHDHLLLLLEPLRPQVWCRIRACPLRALPAFTGAWHWEMVGDMACGPVPRDECWQKPHAGNIVGWMDTMVIAVYAEGIELLHD